jgi:hypothetical protein
MSCIVCKINHPYPVALNGITSPYCTPCFNIIYLNYKMYKCSFCYKSYNTNEMKEHVNFHCKAYPDSEYNKNKINKCSHCDKSYKLKSSLKGHIKNKHGTITIKNDQIGI